MRLIDSQGQQVGIVSIHEALKVADESKLDLVAISPDAKPPVCKIMNYGKFLFEKKKQAAIAKKNQVQTQVKEIKFRPGTEESDYQVKLRAIIKFLESGNKVKVSLYFKGREMAHQNLGMKSLRRIEQDVLAFGQVEQFPKLEGRQLTMLIAPKKKK